MKTFKHSAKIASAVILFGAMLNAHSAITDLSNAPLITSPTSSVLPNVFLMLDDSGSMAWDYMPDKANDFGSGSYGAASSQCNGVYYDPAITYSPPLDSTGTVYANSSFTSAWNNGYNTGGGSTNLSTSHVPAGGGTAGPAFYFKYIGANTTERLKDYYNTSSSFYTECNATASSSTITVGTGTGTSTTISSITVNGVQILSATTAGSTSTTTVASQIAANITANGYNATVSGSTVTIWPPSTAATTFTPVITKSGGLTTTATVFPTPKFLRVPVSATSGAGATDERTNFANWWSYYHTRILMMKTATGRAFSSIGPTFRVGFASINNNTSSVLALDTFDATQKAAWYTKLYGASAANSTPLREALADVGRMYAHLLPASNSNSGLTSSLADPIQFSCQQNFTILTTDGFWNGSTTYKLDGTTVGNQDYFEPRPLYDGSNVVQTTTTPYTTVQTRQSVTTGSTTTTTTTTVANSIGGSCSVPAVTPAGATTAFLLDDSNKHRIALGLASSDPDPSNSHCYKLGGTGANTAWLCRGSTNSDPAVSLSTATDSTGKKWYLVSSGANAAGCVNDNAVWGSNYSTTKGACPGTAAVSGSTVTTTTTVQPVTTSGQTQTVVSTYTANQSTTQTTSNGVTGPVSALSPTTLTYSLTSTAAPTYTGTATSSNGTATVTTTSACVAPPLPSTTPVVTSSTTSTGGTTTTSTLSTVGPTAGTPNTTGTSSGGTSNTLADVAEYYYITDLRTTALGNNLSGAAGVVNGTDISANNVPSSGLDAAAHQHMTTFTLGLGARGRMVFDPAYESATTGDFYAVKQGSTATGAAGPCPWQASGSCNWPTPASDAIENIDDLWHAAVDGRGTYFSAANPTGLATALSTALAGVSARTGSAAAATTSNAFVTQGDNFLFRSTFVSQQWTGELIRQQLDVNTGAVLSAVDWSAQAQLDAKTTRNIYFFDSGSSTKLSSFTLANLTTAGLNNYFSQAYIASLSQLCTSGATCLPSWTATTVYPAGSVYKYVNAGVTTWYKVNTTYTSLAAFGATDTTNSSVYDVANANLVNYIRGDRTNEGADTDLTKYYRQRNHVLGDIVNSETNYVKGALSPNYADPGHSAYETSMIDRQSMVYVGANDGMLHAFYAADGQMSSTTGHTLTGGVTVTGGDEAFAFIPTAVIPNLYNLADKNYAMQHRYFVDGDPVTADICVSNCTIAASAVWKTILVGGLNSGGKSYYALDITNPAQPKALWEFTHANMGYTFSPPKIVKLKPTVSYPAGQWVVLMTSGYNNTSGDGQGYLYVADAYTGALATSVNGNGIIGTGVGSVATPSGLGHFDAQLVTPGVDSTVVAVYSGDMLGNLWRFDVNGDTGATGYDAQLLATLRGPSGNVQPITTKPLLTLVNTTTVVLVGTGRYLGSTDLADTSQQSFYAIKDTFPSGSTPSIAIWGNPRTQGTFVNQSQTTTNCPVGSSSNICTTGQSVVVSSNTPVDFSSNAGWYVDFPLAGPSPIEGERVNTDPAIINGTLIFNTNAPNASSCSVGGDSYQYQLNYKTGGAVASSTTGVVATKLGNELSTRPVVATLLDGTSKAYTQGSGGGKPTSSTVWDNSGGGGGSTATGTPNRRSWRQLIKQ